MERASREALEHYARLILGLHEKFVPHGGQIPVGRALFNDGFKDIFVEAGRNWGKTTLICYLLWRYSQFYPMSENYYFAPYNVQAKEIVWSPQLMQSFGPKDWIASVNNTEMRITFKNGSFIKCSGSDNVDSFRGVKPKGLTVFDEFKDFRPEFYDAYDPNRAAHNSPLVIIGTPPDRESQFSQVKKLYQADKKKRYFHGPTHANPHISKEWLANKKAELVMAGDENKWQREYEALEVYGGKAKIFPMLTRDVIRPHAELIKELHRDRKRIEWIWWADPAGASVFAILFAAYNPYSKNLYLLDEIYEDRQEEMTVKRIGPRIFDKKAELEEASEWREGYDEAATWFRNEMAELFDIGLEASQKSANSKLTGIGLIKDIMLQAKLHVSDRCKKVFWELDNYFKDDHGDIPKGQDHMIDNLRYIIAAVGYSVKETEYREPNTMDDDIFFEKKRLKMRVSDTGYDEFERDS